MSYDKHSRSNPLYYSGVLMVSVEHMSKVERSDLAAALIEANIRDGMYPAQAVYDAVGSGRVYYTELAEVCDEIAHLINPILPMK